SSAARYLQQCILNHQQSPRQLFTSRTSSAAATTTTATSPPPPPTTTSASVGAAKTLMDKYEFAVRHYAGQVWYDCGQFVEKNRLQIKWETIKLLATSKNSVKYLINYLCNNSH
ncbi:unnamed protein product, partial [Litomosoides sigmodontis]